MARRARGLHLKWLHLPPSNPHHGRGDGAIEALSDLDEVDRRLSDSGVSLDLGEMRVVIEVDVAGDDHRECVSHALGAIRMAIHSAGGTTPE